MPYSHYQQSTQKSRGTPREISVLRQKKNKIREREKFSALLLVLKPTTTNTFDFFTINDGTRSRDL